MMHSMFILGALLAAPGPHLTIPAEVTPNGQYAKFLPDTDCVGVMYVGLDGVDSVPSDLLKDGRTFLLDTRGLAIGRYRFAAIGAEKDGTQLRADFAVVVGTPPPGPTPPGPTPPTPGPADLIAALKAAYGKDGSDAAALEQMQSLFTGLPFLAKGQKALKTTLDFDKWLQGVIESSAAGLKGKLANTKAAISAELNTALGAPSATALDLTKAADELTKISEALDGVK